MKKRIALLLLGVSSRNCGGAERFFSDFFYQYKKAGTEHELLFFADSPTLDTLEAIGKLDRGDGVVELKNISNRFKRFLENMNLLRNIIRYKIKLVHVTNYGRNYYDRLSFLKKLPGVIRPQIIINIVDCEIPYVLSDPASPKHEGYKLRYLPLFRGIKPDGVFTWYSLFCDFARKEKLLPDNALLESAQTRFADTAGFAPANEKKKQIVFAARLTQQKQPLMFVEAVKILHQKYPQLIQGWEFHVYGNGPLENEIENAIDQRGISSILQLHSTADLHPVFANSSCFVSAQDYENFPSLSMNEAMSAGNALIARNVGQTSLFLEDGKNGFLAKEDNASGIAEALAEFLQHPEKHESMMQESLRLAREVHTPANFIRQIDTFWKKALHE